jgi:hypothetical protein
MALARREADLILCSSLATLKDCRAAGFEPERLRHVPLGVETLRADAAEVVRVRRSYAVERPYVLWRWRLFSGSASNSSTSASSRPNASIRPLRFFHGSIVRCGAFSRTMRSRKGYAAPARPAPLSTRGSEPRSWSKRRTASSRPRRIVSAHHLALLENRLDFSQSVDDLGVERAHVTPRVEQPARP